MNTKKKHLRNQLIGILLTNAEGLKYSEIKKELKIDDTTLNSLLKQLIDLGIVEKKDNKYFLSFLLVDSYIRDLIDSYILEIIDVISWITGIPNTSHDKIMQNLEVLVSFLLK